MKWSKKHAELVPKTVNDGHEQTRKPYSMRFQFRLDFLRKRFMNFKMPLNIMLIVLNIIHDL